MDTLRELISSCERLEQIAATQSGWKWHFNATIADPAWAGHIKEILDVPKDIELVVVSVGNRSFDVDFWTKAGRQKEFHIVSKKVKGSFIVVDGAGALLDPTGWVPQAQDLLGVFSACTTLAGSKTLETALGSLVQKGRDLHCMHNSTGVRGEAFVGIGWGTMRNPQTSGGNWAAYKLFKYARLECDMICGVVKDELLPLLGGAASLTLNGANLPTEYHIGGLPGHKLHTTLNAQVKPHFDKRDLSGTIIFWHHQVTSTAPQEDTAHYTEGSFQLYTCFISALLGRDSKICYVRSDDVLHGTYNHSIDGLYRFGSAVYCCKPDITRFHKQFRAIDLKGVCELEWEEAERFESSASVYHGVESLKVLKF